MPQKQNQVIEQYKLSDIEMWAKLQYNVNGRKTSAKCSTNHAWLNETQPACNFHGFALRGMKRSEIGPGKFRWRQMPSSRKCKRCMSAVGVSE